MKRFIDRSAVIFFAFVCVISTAYAQIEINIDAAHRGPKIGDRHYGIFFEEINHAGDGGLYAELIHNRSFEDNQSSPVRWQATDSADVKLVSDGLLNAVQKRALQVKFKAANRGVRNEGFWGIHAVSGRTYTFSFWAKSTEGYNGSLTVGLETASGTSLGKQTVAVNLTDEWKKITGTLTATGNDAQAWFSLTGSKSGTIIVDVVSLFPPTYKGRENGCRIDLAEKLEAMKPAFVRFPGGCYVEGEWRDGKTNRFEWKNTIGPIEGRPGHYCVNWNYNVSDGFGFHEMLQLTEDLGAEPLFVVNMGMGHGWMEPYNKIDEFIQEALDAIEYCNGEVTTEWGAKRAANGHPAPFNLRLIEIGNENYNYTSNGNNDQSDHYAERYIQFYNAIKAKYPEMVMIGDVEAWGTDNPSWRNPHPVDAVDEHYYRNPAWFVSQYSKYDNRDRSLPKVYVGEYAVTSDFGTTGHLRAALGEAVYMLGMENNSDVCVMNSYAPIFVNENDQKWKPDMIRFDSDESFGTPSYHVQRLFPNNVGKQNVKWTETNNEISSGDKFGLSTWSTAATFDNVKVTGENGNIIFSDDFSTSSNWTSPGTGSWSVNSGTLIQTSTSMQGAVYLCNTGTGTNNYTIELDATKTSGAEGFLVAFRYTDSKNYCWWNLGGWNNGQHGVEMCVDGTKTTVASAAGSLTIGKTYRIKIEVAGSAVKCYLDDTLIHDFTLPTERKVYISSTIDDEAGVLYLKMVNPSEEDAPMTINLSNADIKAGTLILMTEDSEAENTMSNKTKVCPAESTLTGINGNSITYTAPAYSLNILRIEVDNITHSDNGGEQATQAAVETFKNEVANAMCRLNFLHTAMSLPTTTTGGATMTWSLEEETGGYVSLSGNGISYTLSVHKLAQGEKVKAGVLRASVTFSDGSVADVDYDIHVAPDDEMYGYLYCFMSSAKEITNYALGTKEDKGKVFNVLLGGAEVFDTEAVAKIEGGTRDAFILRGEKANQYLMACTDMCNAKSGIWNNYGMDLLTSTDLIHWESVTFDFRQGKSIFSDPDATTDSYKTDEEYAKINRVWAPQMIWDKSVNKYLVYYSLLSTNSGDNYDKIYYSYADEDFKTLTQPRIFFDPGFSVIDGDILYNPYDGLYHMYYKRESAGGQDRGVYEAVSPVLVGGEWTDITHVTNEGTAQVEGSSHIRRINEDTYNLYYMRYSEGYEYKVCETNHVGLNTTSSAALQGTGNFQHGSFITLTETEYKMLEVWDKLIKFLPSCYDRLEEGYDYYEFPIQQAESALQLTSVDELAVELEKAYQALSEADKRFKNELLSGATEENPLDITSMLVNPDFSQGSVGWGGTSFTAANGKIAEQYSKTFDNYQTLTDMPAGRYVFSCQGFYRYGSIETAVDAHMNATERMLPVLYMGTSTSPFMCIYDEDDYSYDGSYTYPDNVSQANIAFNEDGLYQGNSVELILNEPGDIKLGMRKTEYFDRDWVIFDNFKLMYYGYEEVASIPEGMYYLQNVASDKYLVGGNRWGTQASLDDTGLKVKVSPTPSAKYTIDTYVYNGSNTHYLGTNGYVDSELTEWNIKEESPGLYSITSDGTNYLGYNGTSVVDYNITDAGSYETLWRLRTEEELYDELSSATQVYHKNATFLIPGADFNRNDIGNSEWSDSPAIGGNEYTNYCGEKWHTSTFDVGQELTDIPNGYYRLFMRGFYRMGGTDANDAAIADEKHQDGTEELNAIFYANDEEMPLMSIMEGAQEEKFAYGLSFSTSMGYVPQDMSSAATAIMDGKYLHSLYFQITDGTLRFGVKKNVASRHDWTIFDNFELFYLGTRGSDIEEIKSTSDNASADIYDLTGRLVRKQARNLNGLKSGVYVVNGKKMVVK